MPQMLSNYIQNLAHNPMGQDCTHNQHKLCNKSCKIPKDMSLVMSILDCQNGPEQAQPVINYTLFIPSTVSITVIVQGIIVGFVNCVLF